MYEGLVKLLRAYSKEHCPLDGASGICGGVIVSDAADAIEELSKAQEQWIVQERNALLKSIPRWIPVTERLPEKYTAVLAAGNGEVACGLFVGFAEPAHVASWDLDNVAAEPVTHWMPLPEPPEEET